MNLTICPRANVEINFTISDLFRLIKEVIVHVLKLRTAGQVVKPHLMSGLRRSDIRDEMICQVFNNVVVCMRTGPI